jgi:hypothetical protein
LDTRGRDWENGLRWNRECALESLNNRASERPERDDGSVVDINDLRMASRQELHPLTFMNPHARAIVPSMNFQCPFRSRAFRSRAAEHCRNSSQFFVISLKDVPARLPAASCRNWSGLIDCSVPCTCTSTPTDYTCTSLYFYLYRYMLNDLRRTPPQLREPVGFLGLVRYAP